jgi:hypothetical protein
MVVNLDKLDVRSRTFATTQVSRTSNRDESMSYLSELNRLMIIVIGS